MPLINNATPTTLLLGAAVAYIVTSVLLVIYRLTLHPLAKFPGPKLAAATEWYDFYHDIIRRGQSIRKTTELHDKYGPIVRLAPDELHVRDATYFSTIYASGAKRQDKARAHIKQTAAPTSALATQDHDLHRLRRAAMNPFFAKQAIASREDIIKARIELLCDRLAGLAPGAEPVELSTAFMALTVDVITRFCYGQSADYLSDPHFGADFSAISLSLTANGRVARHLPWIRDLQQALPRGLLLWLQPGVAVMLAYLQRTRNVMADVVARHGRSERLEDDNIFEAILGSGLPDEEKSVTRMTHEALVLVGAGGETTARTMSAAVFYLLANPEMLERVRKELRGVVESDGSFGLTKLEQLPYFNACLHEALRVAPGIPARLPRVHHDPLTYKHWRIPARTAISQSNYIANHDPAVFPDPHAFLPQRWLDTPHLDKYLASFSKGSRGCVGINLAWAEMRLGLAYVLHRFGLRLFETVEERDVVLDRDMFFGLPTKGSKGIRVVVTGRNA